MTVFLAKTLGLFIATALGAAEERSAPGAIELADPPVIEEAIAEGMWAPVVDERGDFPLLQPGSSLDRAKLTLLQGQTLSIPVEELELPPFDPEEIEEMTVSEGP